MYLMAREWLCFVFGGPKTDEDRPATVVFVIYARCLWRSVVGKGGGLASFETAVGELERGAH